jgi:hypothetical protein
MDRPTLCNQLCFGYPERVGVSVYIETSEIQVFHLPFPFFFAGASSVSSIARFRDLGASDAQRLWSVAALTMTPWVLPSVFIVSADVHFSFFFLSLFRLAAVVREYTSMWHSNAMLTTCSHCSLCFFAGCSHTWQWWVVG